MKFSQAYRHPVFSRLQTSMSVMRSGEHPIVLTTFNTSFGKNYGYNVMEYPRKLHEFKKLKCRYLTAENWKPAPIVRGVGRNKNNDIWGCKVAQMYDIVPHKVRQVL